MTYFKDIKPGDPVPARPVDYTHKLVRVYPDNLQTAYRDDKGHDGGSSYSVSCDPEGGGARVIGAFPPGVEVTASSDRWSPTDLYGFSRTSFTWRGPDVPNSVRSGYDAACDEAGRFVADSLEPFQKSVREDRVTTRPLGALRPIDRPRFEKLVREFGFYAQEAGRSLRDPVATDEVVTVSLRDGARLFTGVDLNHDGILDVLSVHDEAADRDLLIYDLERAPTSVTGVVPRIRVPRDEIDLLRVAKQVGGEACRSQSISHVPFPDHVTPDVPAASTPLRGLLDFRLEPKEGVSPLCARDLFLTIRFYSTDHVNHSGHHRFRVVTDLDRFFRAADEARRRGIEMPSSLPTAHWMADAERRFEIPSPPPDRLWRIGPLSSPSPEVHWTSDREGFIRVTLDSLSADGIAESHPFDFHFRKDEGGSIGFLP